MNFKTIIEFIFPSTCVICGRINKNFLCEKCKVRISKCGKFCFQESKEEDHFDKLFYCYSYEKLIRKLLLKYKFCGKSYISNFFAKELLNCEKTYGFFLNYDIIIPVPMEKEKQLKRGYNQTELIVDIVSESAKIINGKSQILKLRKTKTQSLLKVDERKENIKNAFALKDDNSIHNKRIILFDDIYTTGATANEISRILKEAGAKEILVLVLAKD